MVKPRPVPPDNVTLDVLAGMFRRLNRRVRLLERQNELLCDVVFSLITVERSRGLLEHVKNFQAISRRYADDEDDEQP